MVFIFNGYCESGVDVEFYCGIYFWGVLMCGD